LGRKTPEKKKAVSEDQEDCGQTSQKHDALAKPIRRSNTSRLDMFVYFFALIIIQLRNIKNMMFKTVFKRSDPPGA